MEVGMATKNKVLPVLESMTSKYKETIKSPNTKKKEGRFVDVSVMEFVYQSYFYRFSKVLSHA